MPDMTQFPEILMDHVQGAGQAIVRLVELDGALLARQLGDLSGKVLGDALLKLKLRAVQYYRITRRTSDWRLDSAGWAGLPSPGDVHGFRRARNSRKLSRVSAI